MKLLRICDWLISFAFSLLFFLVPLILTPWNYELFEYNKMMLVYALTIIITGSWLIKMVVHKRFLFQRTPFDLPIALFFVSQFFSFLFSMDRHVSLFGYYSRFNGGLLSVFSYLLLYYALVSNIKLSQLVKFVKLGLLSGLVVSLYGILEHFGIDKNLWVQDVQNRVFSTLGQPNWLGAYLAIIIPIGMGFIFFLKTVDDRKWKIGVENRKSRIEKNNLSSSFYSQSLSSIFHYLSSIFFYFLLSVFYLCLLYTKSRSGLMGFGIAFLVFWFLIFLVCLKKRILASQEDVLQNFFRPFFLLSTFYFLLSALVGTPWTPSISQIINHKSEIVAPATGPALEAGGTESGEIRKIVWSGAIDIARHYPLFGTGPETFAYAYYKFRPVAHNLVSEWDFLYNKAHNEYLNYAATTGFVGLGTYLLFIGWFMVWSVKQFKMQNDKIILHLALFAAWLSILITNFFGFSVVIISVYFWLIPAMVVVITKNDRHAEFSSASDQILKQVQNDVNKSEAAPSRCKHKQWVLIILILFAICYLLFAILRMWYADVRFNRGYQLSRAGYYQQAYKPFHEAIAANPGEPFYHDELSFVNAMLSVAASQQKEATLSSQLAQEALLQNQKALEISPQNVNFWKTRTKVFYTLDRDQIALESLTVAQELAPTDPKITYNIALLYGRLGKKKEAIKTLEETIRLKPNYQDARYALALFYHEAGKKKEAIIQLQYILKYISPTDTQIQEKLREWGK